MNKNLDIRSRIYSEFRQNLYHQILRYRRQTARESAVPYVTHLRARLRKSETRRITPKTQICKVHYRKFFCLQKLRYRTFPPAVHRFRFRLLNTTAYLLLHNLVDAVLQQVGGGALVRLGRVVLCTASHDRDLGQARARPRDPCCVKSCLAGQGGGAGCPRVWWGCGTP